MVVIPPRAILAAVDFSEPSQVALEFAARLANQCRATLHVLHVEDPLLAAAARAQGLDLSRETREELAGFTARSIAAGAWTPLNHHVVSGQPTHTICDIASREQTDMIVVGMHGMSGATHALFGSTTEGVLERSDTPVFVVPDSWVPPNPAGTDLSGMGPVIAAIECSCTALAGAAAAVRLAETLRTSVSAVHVVPALHVLDRWRPHAEVVVAEQIAKARVELEQALVGTKTDLDIPLSVVTGSVPEQLAAAVATSGQHSLLVLGRHVRGSRRGVPGATAYRVLGRAHVPVLVHCLPEDHQ
jgi:nucleotide-binding universal stress UspA family protein